MSQNFVTPLLDVAFQLGRLHERTEQWHDNLHTCSYANRMYPWPPEESCEACRRSIEKMMERDVEPDVIATLTWEQKVFLVTKQLEAKAAQAEVNRQRGAYI